MTVALILRPRPGHEARIVHGFRDTQEATAWASLANLRDYVLKSDQGFSTGPVLTPEVVTLEDATAIQESIQPGFTERIEQAAKERVEDEKRRKAEEAEERRLEAERRERAAHEAAIQQLMQEQAAEAEAKAREAARKAAEAELVKRQKAKAA